jgi:hypothetical protein
MSSPSQPPTVRPTVAPTVSPDSGVSFDLWLVLKNILSGLWSTSTENAILKAIADKMGVSVDNLTYLSQSTGRRRLEKYQKVVRGFQPSSTSEITVYVNCEVTMSDFPEYDSPKAVSQGLTSTLETSIRDGTFDTTLQEAATYYDAADLKNASATSVNASDATVLQPTLSPTILKANNHSSNSMSHELIMTIIAIIAFFGGVAIFFLILYVRRRLSTVAESDRAVQMNSRSGHAVNASPLHAPRGNFKDSIVTI